MDGHSLLIYTSPVIGTSSNLFQADNRSPVIRVYPISSTPTRSSPFIEFHPISTHPATQSTVLPCLPTRPYIYPAFAFFLLLYSTILHLCSRIGRDYKNMANISNIVPQMDRRYFMGVSQSFASYRKDLEYYNFQSPRKGQ